MSKDFPKIALVMPEFRGGFIQETIPLNLAYLAAVLRLNGFPVRCFNLQQEDRNQIDFSRFDIIGFTATTSMYFEALEIIRAIKKKTSALIVIGGAQATAQPEQVARQREIDLVVYGEGENSLLEICQAVKNRQSFKSVRGICYRDAAGKIIKTGPQPIIKDLDALPFPAKDLFDVSRYPDRKRAYGDIIASRGCPFRCTNCQPGLKNISRYRVRSVEKVVDEIEENVKRYGVRHFTFSDSELAGPPKWVIKLCREILHRRIKITFSCNGRTDQVTDEVLIALKRAGCIFIGYGIESGSKYVLEKILDKGINLGQTREVIARTVRLGIGTGCWFMVGIPGERPEDIRASIDYAKQLDASTIEVNIATPWPDTGFYQVCKKNNWLLTEDWRRYNEKNSPVISTPYLSPDDTLKAFRIFINEMKAIGWRFDARANRLYHPQFLRRTIRTGLGAILKRGLQFEDIKKGLRMTGVKI